MSSLEDEQATGQPRAQAGTMLREDDLDEAKETAETKGELSREDVHDILQGMQDLHEDGPQPDSRERSDAHPCGQRLQGTRLEV